MSRRYGSHHYLWIPAQAAKVRTGVFGAVARSSACEQVGATLPLPFHLKVPLMNTAQAFGGFRLPAEVILSAAR